MPRGIRSEHLDNMGWQIMKATLEQKRTIFLFADREYFETTLADLRSVANLMTSPRVTFAPEAHVITHNMNCANEISLTCYTIYGEVHDR